MSKKKEAIEIQTDIVCTPHLLREGDQAKVQCNQLLQTLASSPPNAPIEDIYEQLERVDCDKISADSIKIMKYKIHFDVPDNEDNISFISGEAYFPKEYDWDTEAPESIPKEGHEHKEIQTKLMVTPHCLRRGERADVVCDVSTQTAVTCEPQCSVTEIVPKFITYLDHSSHPNVTAGDNAHNKSILDVISDILTEVDATSKQKFVEEPSQITQSVTNGRKWPESLDLTGRTIIPIQVMEKELSCQTCEQDSVLKLRTQKLLNVKCVTECAHPEVECKFENCDLFPNVSFDQCVPCQEGGEKMGYIKLMQNICKDEAIPPVTIVSTEWNFGIPIVQQSEAETIIYCTPNKGYIAQVMNNDTTLIQTVEGDDVLIQTETNYYLSTRYNGELEEKLTSAEKNAGGDDNCCTDDCRRRSGSDEKKCQYCLCKGFKINLCIKNFGFTCAEETNKIKLDLKLLPGLKKLEIKGKMKEEEDVSEEETCLQDCCPAKNGKMATCPFIIKRMGAGSKTYFVEEEQRGCYCNMPDCSCCGDKNQETGNENRANNSGTNKDEENKNGSNNEANNVEANNVKTNDVEANKDEANNDETNKDEANNVEANTDEANNDKANNDEANNGKKDEEIKETQKAPTGIEFCQKTSIKKNKSLDILNCRVMSICNLMGGAIMALVSRNKEGFDVIINIHNPRLQGDGEGIKSPQEKTVKCPCTSEPVAPTENIRKCTCPSIDCRCSRSGSKSTSAENIRKCTCPSIDCRCSRSGSKSSSAENIKKCTCSSIDCRCAGSGSKSTSAENFKKCTCSSIDCRCASSDRKSIQSEPLSSDSKSTKSEPGLPDDKSVKSETGLPDGKSEQSEKKSVQSQPISPEGKSEKSEPGLPDDKSERSEAGLPDSKSEQSDKKSVQSQPIPPEGKSEKSEPGLPDGKSEQSDRKSVQSQPISPEGKSVKSELGLKKCTCSFIDRKSKPLSSDNKSEKFEPGLTDGKPEESDRKSVQSQPISPEGKSVKSELGLPDDKSEKPEPGLTDDKPEESDRKSVQSQPISPEGKSVKSELGLPDDKSEKPEPGLPDNKSEQSISKSIQSQPISPDGTSVKSEPSPPDGISEQSGKVSPESKSVQSALVTPDVTSEQSVSISSDSKTKQAEPVPPLEKPKRCSCTYQFCKCNNPINATKPIRESITKPIKESVTKSIKESVTKESISRKSEQSEPDLPDSTSEQSEPISPDSKTDQNELVPLEKPKRCSCTYQHCKCNNPIPETKPIRESITKPIKESITKSIKESVTKQSVSQKSEQSEPGLPGSSSEQPAPISADSKTDQNELVPLENLPDSTSEQSAPISADSKTDKNELVPLEKPKRCSCTYQYCKCNNAIPVIKPIKESVTKPNKESKCGCSSPNPVSSEKLVPSEDQNISNEKLVPSENQKKSKETCELSDKTCKCFEDDEPAKPLENNPIQESKCIAKTCGCQPPNPASSEKLVPSEHQNISNENLVPSDDQDILNQKLVPSEDQNTSNETCQLSEKTCKCDKLDPCEDQNILDQTLVPSEDHNISDEICNCEKLVPSENQNISNEKLVPSGDQNISNETCQLSEKTCKCEKLVPCEDQNISNQILLPSEDQNILDETCNCEKLVPSEDQNISNVTGQLSEKTCNCETLIPSEDQNMLNQKLVPSEEQNLSSQVNEKTCKCSSDDESVNSKIEEPLESASKTSKPLISDQSVAICESGAGILEIEVPEDSENKDETSEYKKQEIPPLQLESPRSDNEYETCSEGLSPFLTPHCEPGNICTYCISKTDDTMLKEDTMAVGEPEKLPEEIVEQSIPPSRSSEQSRIPTLIRFTKKKHSKCSSCSRNYDQLSDEQKEYKHKCNANCRKKKFPSTPNNSSIDVAIDGPIEKIQLDNLDRQVRRSLENIQPVFATEENPNKRTNVMVKDVPDSLVPAIVPTEHPLAPPSPVKEPTEQPFGLPLSVKEPTEQPPDLPLPAVEPAEHPPDSLLPKELPTEHQVPFLQVQISGHPPLPVEIPTELPPVPHLPVHIPEHHVHYTPDNIKIPSAHTIIRLPDNSVVKLRLTLDMSGGESRPSKKDSIILPTQTVDSTPQTVNSTPKDIQSSDTIPSGVEPYRTEKVFDINKSRESLATVGFLQEVNPVLYSGSKTFEIFPSQTADLLEVINPESSEAVPHRTSSLKEKTPYKSSPNIYFDSNEDVTSIGTPENVSKTVLRESKQEPENKDIVFMAYKTCEEELKSSFDALRSIKEELRKLNMPEVDCIFKQADLYTPVSKSNTKSQEKLRAKIKYSFMNSKLSSDTICKCSLQTTRPRFEAVNSPPRPRSTPQNQSTKCRYKNPDFFDSRWSMPEDRSKMSRKVHPKHVSGSPNVSSSKSSEADTLCCHRQNSSFRLTDKSDSTQSQPIYSTGKIPTTSKNSTSHHYTKVKIKICDSKLKNTTSTTTYQSHSKHKNGAYDSAYCSYPTTSSVYPTYSLSKQSVPESYCSHSLEKAIQSDKYSANSLRARASSRADQSTSSAVSSHVSSEEFVCPAKHKSNKGGKRRKHSRCSCSSIMSACPFLEAMKSVLFSGQFRGSRPRKRERRHQH